MSENLLLPPGLHMTIWDTGENLRPITYTAKDEKLPREPMPFAVVVDGDALYYLLPGQDASVIRVDDKNLNSK